MKSRTWLIFFSIIILFVCVLIISLNVIVDPFGVFGDQFLNFYSFNMTENPRVAKIAYLDKNYKEYDSFVIGASGSSVFSPELLNKYTNNKYYNMFVYGAEMSDMKDFTECAIKKYNAKNILLSIALINATNIDRPKDDATKYMHAEVEKTSKLPFYLKYMFANPQYSFVKITDFKKDTYLQQGFDLFVPQTGTYDKSSRDIEAFGEMNGYLEQYPVFKNYIEYYKALNHIDECVKQFAEIKKMCDENNVNLKVVIPPMYYRDAKGYEASAVKELYKKLAEVTGFWDFTLSQISTDMRYFYDKTHFRNSVGKMMIEKMYGDESNYIPSDFGAYVTKENAEEQAEKFAKNWEFSDSNYTAKVPVIMYHAIEEEGNGSTIVKAENFENQIKALSENGFTSVSFEELCNYVEKGINLPKKPVVITFDDGYTDNYKYAYPVLKKYNMKATISAIGNSVGKDTYRNTNRPTMPHFGTKEMAEMSDSGLISIQSHTYDMHQWGPNEEAMGNKNPRLNVLQLKGEKEIDYIRLFTNDFLKSKEVIEKATNKKVFLFCYPNGIHDTLSEVLLSQLGIKVTLITETGVNTIIKGIPQTLLDLKRMAISDEDTPEKLIERLKIAE